MSPNEICFTTSEDKVWYTAKKSLLIPFVMPQENDMWVRLKYELAK